MKIHVDAQFNLCRQSHSFVVQAIRCSCSKWQPDILIVCVHGKSNTQPQTCTFPYRAMKIRFNDDVEAEYEEEYGNSVYFVFA